MSEQPRHCIVAIVPCTDIESSTAFYGRIGLSVHSDHGIYLYVEDVDGVAARVRDLTKAAGPQHTPWGMYEFSLSDPDGTRVRIGWPSRMIQPKSRDEI